MKRNLLAGAMVILGTVLTGCAGGGVYYSSFAPPPPRYGAVGVAPGPGYVWADGYWDLRGRNWVWAPGAWVRPPHRGAAYVHPEWRQEGGRWRYHQGYWR